MKRFKNTQAGSFLYSLGVNYFEYGVIKQGGKQMFDYFKTDGISENQKQKILDACPDAQFKIASPQYAPEIRKQIVCFPKAAFYRMQKGE